MKAILSAAVCFALHSLSSAEEASTLEPLRAAAASQAPRAWLGLRLSKPDETVTAHLPSLPPGIGFIIKSIDASGPAETSGLREMDLLWKIGDQMLVNEAQLATLLRLFKPGDDIVLAGFRAGKPLEVRLKLGEAPALARPFPGEMVEAAVLPGVCPGPMRVVNVAEKSASFTTEEGKAVVRREGAVFLVKIHGEGDSTVFDGDISSEADFAKIPSAWQNKVRVLCRTLEQALDGKMVPQRQPRPRVVPPSP
jgi:hypothetical protein